MTPTPVPCPRSRSGGRTPRCGLVLALVGLLASGALAVAPDVHPAQLAPADVSVFVHVQHAAGVRADLAARPLGAALETILADGPLGVAWHKLVAASGLDEDAFFDLWLGRDAALMLRGNVAGELGIDPTKVRDWTIVTSIDRDRLADAVERFNPKRLGDRGGAIRFSLPEHDLLVAIPKHGDRCVVGPIRDDGLTESVLDRALARRAEGGLAATESFARFRALDRTVRDSIRVEAPLGPGAVAVYLKHEALMGGWSWLAARPRGPLARGEWAIRHAGSFEAPPFDRPVTRERTAPHMLPSFEREALIAFVEPTDIGEGPFAAFIEGVLQEPLVAPELRQRMGEERMIIVGEIDGRGPEGGPDVLLPAVAIATSITDDTAATIRRDVDRHMLNLAHGLERLGVQFDAPFALDVPRIEDLPAHGARHIDLGPAIAALYPEMPLLDTVTLNWECVKGPSGVWVVVATHRAHCATVTRVLRTESERVAPSAHWASCGVLNGPRLGGQLRSWADRPELFVDEHEGTGAFARSLRMLALVAGGVERAWWWLERPEANTMELEIHLKLRAPESAGPTASK